MDTVESRIMCVVNPISANGKTKKRWGKLEQELRQRGQEFQVEITKKPGHATELTRQALISGYNRVVAVGGDGTLNEVVNGYFDDNHSCINQEAGLSIISMGTGGDFFRTLGLSSNLEALIKSMKQPEIHKCDLVKAQYNNWANQPETRYFINVADIGLGSETVARVNRNSKRWGGFLSFLSSAIYTILVYKNKYLSIYIDGQEIYTGYSCLVAVANGKYFGGGMKVAPNAEINDGYLDVIVAKDMTKMQLIKTVSPIYQGQHLSLPQVKVYHAQTVQIKTQERVCLEVDGETPGQGDASFEIAPAAINLML